MYKKISELINEISDSVDYISENIRYTEDEPIGIRLARRSNENYNKLNIFGKNIEDNISRIINKMININLNTLQLSQQQINELLNKFKQIKSLLEELYNIFKDFGYFLMSTLYNLRMETFRSRYLKTAESSYYKMIEERKKFFNLFFPKVVELYDVIYNVDKDLGSDILIQIRRMSSIFIISSDIINNILFESEKIYNKIRNYSLPKEMQESQRNMNENTPYNIDPIVLIEKRKIQSLYDNLNNPKYFNKKDELLRQIYESETY